jgi:hypothetical protein
MKAGRQSLPYSTKMNGMKPVAAIAYFWLSERDL